jgi:hypothetical protein
MQNQVNQSPTEVTDFFLAEDIIQSENVPFYLLWTGEKPLRIELEFTGFKSLVELHNSPMESAIFEENKVLVSNFVVDGYLGGILSTEVSENSNQRASLDVKIINSDHTYQSLQKNRIIYGTVTSVPDIPTNICLLESNTNIEKIEVLLCGETTVFFDVEELEDNECNIDVPADIKEEIERITNFVRNGLYKLKKEYPQHSNLIDFLLELPEKKISMSTYIEEMDKKISDAFKDEVFADEFMTLYLTAILQKNSLGEIILKPLNEYFKNDSKDKVYFSNPLLSINMNPGSCRLAIKLRAINLVNEECGDPIEIKTTVYSESVNNIPIRELFCLRRI